MTRKPAAPAEIDVGLLVVTQPAEQLTIKSEERAITFSKCLDCSPVTGWARNGAGYQMHRTRGRGDGVFTASASAIAAAVASKIPPRREEGIGWLPA